MKNDNLSVNINLPIEIPSVPNFVKIGGAMIPVGDLSEKTKRFIGREWTKNLIIKGKAKFK